MSNVKVNLQEVSDLASKIRIVNNNIYDTLTKAKVKMNDLNTTWQSDGSDAIRNKFNILSNRFATQKDLIEQYSKFLDHTVNTYDTLESTIVFNANNVSE